jgi:hypothetical protein
MLHPLEKGVFSNFGSLILFLGGEYQKHSVKLKELMFSLNGPHTLQNFTNPMG